jgi:hypothetical protein
MYVVRGMFGYWYEGRGMVRGGIIIVATFG